MAVHPDFEYVLVQTQSSARKLIVAKDLLPQVIQRVGEQLANASIVKTFKGSELERLSLKHPFNDPGIVPIVLGASCNA